MRGKRIKEKTTAREDKAVSRRLLVNSKLKIFGNI